MEKMTIVVIAYNRPKSLQRLLNSLNNLMIPKKEKVRLYISIDKDNKNGVENKQTVELAKKFNWKFGEKIVSCKDKNMGLKKHVLSCGNLTNIYENIIVLEDDIVVSSLMYIYASKVIEFYKNDDNIAGFGLYSFQRNPLNNLPFYPMNNATDVFFMQYACSWGQIWTKDRWNNFYNWYEINKDKDFSKLPNIPDNVKNWGEKSWLKYHIIYTIINNKFFVYPQVGLASNFTEAGTHNKLNSIAYQCNIYSSIDTKENITFKFIPLKNATNLYDAFFENININNYIKSDKNIIADFYGGKPEKCLKQKDSYILSSKLYNYKIIKSYGLNMYPYEMNIINNIEGEDLFLYNPKIIQKNKTKNKFNKVLRYIFKIDFFTKKEMLDITKYFIYDIKQKIIIKIKRKLK